MLKVFLNDILVLQQKMPVGGVGRFGLVTMDGSVKYHHFSAEAHF